MIPQHHIKLLGALSIEDGDQPARIMTSAKGSALIAYLIITNQTQKREAVADLLWDAASTRHSLQNLRELLGRIRKWLPELQITRQTVAFQPTKDTFIDLFVLRAALPSTELPILDDALALYTGDLLASFYIEGATRFNEWLRIERERLRRQVLGAYHYLCQMYIAQEAWSHGIDVAHRWLKLDDLAEDAYRWLMQCLAANGQIAAALQTYETCRQTLRESLGVTPSKNTIELAQQLTVWVTATTAVSLPSTLLSTILNSGTLPPPHHLPPNTILPYLRNNDFVGRTANLLQIAAYFGETVKAHCPVIAITGMGGVGKTQTAVEFCYRYGRYFTGGIYWLSFAKANTIAEAVAATGGERGLKLFRQTDNLTLTDQVERVQQAWQDPIPRLLIFDNCETEQLLKQWLPVTGGCHILITSRRHTWARELGVKVVPLNPLNPTESITLLQHFTPDLTPTEATAIANEVGHLPLALHLAGSFLHRYTHIPPSTYLHQLRQTKPLQHPSLQGYGTQHSPTGHQLHLERTFTLNLKQLEPTTPETQLARQLLIYIAAFAPGEPIPTTLLWTTLAVSDDLTHLLLAKNSLDHLGNLGFIRQEEAKAIIMHRLVAAFVTLNLPSELNLAQIKITQMITQQLTQQQHDQRSLAKLPFVNHHLHHLTLEALKHNIPHATQLANHLGRHLYDIGHYEAAHHILTTVLTRQAVLERDNEPETAVTHLYLGALETRLKHFELAQAHYEQALTIREQILGPHHPQTAACLSELGLLLCSKEAYQQAYPHLMRALTILEQTLPPNHIEIGESLNHIGLLHSKTGNYEQAQHYLERALAIRTHNLGESHPIVGQALNNLGVLHLRRVAYPQARAYLKRGLVIRQQELGDAHPSVATGMHNLGRLLLLMGQYKTAETYLKKALAIREKAFGESHLDTITAANYLGWSYLLQGHYALAQTTLHQALTISQALQKTPHKGLADSYYYLGMLHTQTAQYQTARSYLEQAYIDYTHLFGPEDRFTAHSQSALGHLFMQQGDLKLAHTHLQQALAIQQKVYRGQHPETAVTLHHLGDLHCQQPDLHQAKIYLDQCLQIRKTILGDTHPDTAQTLVSFGHWHHQHSNDDIAQTHYQQAYTILQNCLAPTHIILKQLHSILFPPHHDNSPPSLAH